MPVRSSTFCGKCPSQLAKHVPRRTTARGFPNGEVNLKRTTLAMTDLVFDISELCVDFMQLCEYRQIAILEDSLVERMAFQCPVRSRLQTVSLSIGTKESGDENVQIYFETGSDTKGPRLAFKNPAELSADREATFSCRSRADRPPARGRYRSRTSISSIGQTGAIQAIRQDLLRAKSLLQKLLRPRQFEHDGFDCNGHRGRGLQAISSLPG